MHLICRSLDETENDLQEPLNSITPLAATSSELGRLRLGDDHGRGDRQYDRVLPGESQLLLWDALL